MILNFYLASPFKGDTLVCLWVHYHHLQQCPQKLGLNFLCASGIKSVLFCFDAKMCDKMYWLGQFSACPSANSATPTQLAVDQQSTVTRIPSPVGEKKGERRKYVTN